MKQSGDSTNTTQNSVADPLDEPMECESGACPPSGLVQQLPSGGSHNLSPAEPIGLVQQLPSGCASDVSQSTPKGLVQQLPSGSSSDVSQSKLRPLFVEVFSGRASFSRAMIQAGFEVVSVDHEVDTPFAPVVSLDLSSETGQRILKQILSSKRLVAIHFGLPCGTASKARDRPISQELQRQGVPSPAPLRSAEYPLGIPGIFGLSKLKVEKANELYRFTLEILVSLEGRDIAISIENPFGSYLWAALVKLTMEHSKRAMSLYNRLEMVRFHSCCHGSKRRKDTGWLSTPGVFKALYAVCANDHLHEPWGVSWAMGTWRFDTSSEASYPVLLAQRAAACLVQYATSRKFVLCPQPRLHDLATASLGKQSKKHKPLVPEYHRVAFQSKHLPISDGAKIIAPHRRGVEREEDVQMEVEMTNLSEKVKVGYFHTPKQFVSMSMGIKHPMDSVEHLEEATVEALHFNLHYPLELVKIERKKNLLHSRILAKKLAAEEAELHSGLPACLRKVLEGKNLLLWRDLLLKYNYDDLGVVDFMTRGVPLVGVHDTPPCYPELLRPATMTEDDLRRTAIWRRKAMLSRTHMGDPAHVEHLLKTTEEELSLGFLEGPFFSEDQVTKFLGRDDWSLIRRFVLVQGAEGKLRPIDDCLEAQLNFAYTSTSYLKLQDVDYISGLALRIASSVVGGKQKSGSGRWLGKCLDLSKAYKQMGVLPAHRDLSVIFFHDAGGKPRFYVSNSLMFGATAAVYAFNRVSRSLWFLFNRMLHIPCGVFYDDFPMFSPEELAGDADQAASELLDLLGWKHARTGPKGKPFENCFNVLGCSLKLDRLQVGEVLLENKQGRLERIISQLDEIRTAKRMTLHQAQVLHGLLRYSCGFFAGRHMQQVCAEVLHLGRSVSLQSRGRLEEFCQYATACLESCKPRKIHAGGDLRPVLIFTDASWESQVGGLGAVVIDTAGGRVAIYSGQVDDSLKHHWMKEIGDHLICQLELYVMVSLRWSLRSLLRDRRTIWWVDNEAARYSLIKGQSGSDSMNKLVRQYYHFDGDHPTYSWIERVPSFSNPADAPSRFKPELAKEWFPSAEIQSLACDAGLVERLVSQSAGRIKGGKI